VAFFAQEREWDGVEGIKFASAFIWRKDPRMALWEGDDEYTACREEMVGRERKVVSQHAK